VCETAAAALSVTELVAWPTVDVVSPIACADACVAAPTDSAGWAMWPEVREVAALAASCTGCAACAPAA
jgi:hypothetical protein